MMIFFLRRAGARSLSAVVSVRLQCRAPTLDVAVLWCRRGAGGGRQLPMDDEGAAGGSPEGDRAALGDAAAGGRGQGQLGG